MADFEARKKHLIAELEETLQSSCYFDLRFLNEKFELNLEYPEEADRKVFDLWNHHQDRPCYKDFKENWALDGDRSKGEDRATVEYRYIFWLTEIKLLERVAEWRGIHLQRVEGKFLSLVSAIVTLMAHGLEASTTIMCISAGGFLCCDRKGARCGVLRTGPDGGICNTTVKMDPTSEVLAQTASINVPANWTARTETEGVIPYHTRYYRKRGQPSIRITLKASNTSPHPKRKLSLLLSYELVQSELLYVLSIYLHLPFVSPVDVPRTDPPNRRTRTGLRPSITATHSSNRGITGPCRKDDRRDYRGTGTKRTMVTAIECVSASGEYLNPMIIWPASTYRSNWTTYSTPGWFYGLSRTDYNDSFLGLEWIKRVFDPQTKARANGKPRILICDGFGTHETLEIIKFCLENSIILCRLPSHTSHKTQRCDVSVFGPLKTAYRDEVERRYHGGLTNTPVTPVSSEAVTQLLSLIKQDSRNEGPNEILRHRLTQKLANAAQRSIAQQTLNRNYIRLFKAANDEAKTRRNTKSDILKKPGKNGEGRVMRQEDLEAIRVDSAERAKQDTAKKAAGKAKRGRPKATTLVDRGEEGKKRGRKRESIAAEEGAQMSKNKTRQGHQPKLHEQAKRSLIRCWKRGEQQWHKCGDDR
ncbi:DDE-1 domain containing protein [Curvularia clavata]|uniref:DDE-1 domain containing protein n=1 Tax=Curvularia clavata TaxID=95742 RepID=A0A9Q9DXS1_CURCL|nr:DDE-1 domain containing protein [Curvularia clavata]